MMDEFTLDCYRVSNSVRRWATKVPAQRYIVPTLTLSSEGPIAEDPRSIS